MVSGIVVLESELGSDPSSITCQLCDFGQDLSTVCLSFPTYKIGIVIPTAWTYREDHGSSCTYLLRSVSGSS